jgi:hypothetical protein
MREKKSWIECGESQIFNDRDFIIEYQNDWNITNISNISNIASAQGIIIRGRLEQCRANFGLSFNDSFFVCFF